MKIINVVGKE